MTNNTDLFDAFNNLSVLIVGDVMIDRYLTGNVNRISPEAPVPVVHLQNHDDRLGGAANVALNIKALGATPFLCSVIGQDENARIFRGLLPLFGLPDRGLVSSPDRMTTVKTRIMASGQQLLRIDEEVSDDLNESEARDLLHCVRELLNNERIDVILFQDYNKGVLSATVIREIILEALRRDIPTAVDPKFHNFWAYRHITLFKPNLKEIKAQLANVQPSLSSLREAASQVRNRLGNTYTLITLSERGLYYDEESQSEIIPTQPRSIADVCGAGDTVISIAALGLGLRLDMREIALLANLAGGQVCERVGVVPVDKAQLQQEYEALKALS